MWRLAEGCVAIRSRQRKSGENGELFRYLCAVEKQRPVKVKENNCPAAHNGGKQKRCVTATGKRRPPFDFCLFEKNAGQCQQHGVILGKSVAPYGLLVDFQYNDNIMPIAQLVGAEKCAKNARRSAAAAAGDNSQGSGGSCRRRKARALRADPAGKGAPKKRRQRAVRRPGALLSAA